MGIFDAVSSVFGGDTNVSGSTPQPYETSQINLESQQINRQNQLQNILLPYQLKQMGLTGVFDPSGNLTSVSEIPKTDLQNQQDALAAQNMQVQGLQNQREIDALNGNLPVSPQLERELGDQRETLTNTLRKQLGTGYETSDPGIKSLATFDQRANETRENARMGMITQASQIGNTSAGQTLSSAQLAEAIRAARMGDLAGISGAYNPGISSIGSALNYGLNQRLGFSNLQLNADQFNSKQASSTFENQMNRLNTQATAPFGGGGGGGMGGIAAMFA